MTESTPTAHAPPQRRMLTFRALLCACIALGVIGVITVRLARRNRPLHEVVLPEGTTLQLWGVSVGKNRHFDLEREFPSSPQVQKLIGRWIPSKTANVRDGDLGTTVWLSPVDTKSGQPGDMPWLGYAVIRDQQGWKHPLQQTGMYGQVRTGVGVDSYDRHVAFSLLSHAVQGHALPAVVLKNHSRTLVGLTFPRLLEQEAVVELYNLHQQRVAEIPVHIPADNELRGLSVPPALPVTREYNGLAVTLTGLDVVPIPDAPHGVQVNNVTPRLSFSWQGGDAGGWSRASGWSFQITDDLDNRADSDWCTLSPHARHWTFEIEVPLSHSARVPDNQRFRTSPIRIPTPGEVLTVGESKKSREFSIAADKFFGAGRHEYLREFSGVDALQFQSQFRLRQPRDLSGHIEGFRGIPELVPQGINLPFETSCPILFLTMQGNATHQYYTRILDTSGKPVGYAIPYAILHPELPAFPMALPLPADMAGLEVILEFVVAPPMKYEFTIRPPAISP